MIKVELLIDNNTTHSCSPIEFLRTFILQGAIRKRLFDKNEDDPMTLINPYATIYVSKIEQE
jgi:hypothetical protein